MGACRNVVSIISTLIIVVIFGPLVPVCMLLLGPLVWLQLCALDNIDRHSYGAAQNIATILVVADVDTHVIRNLDRLAVGQQHYLSSSVVNSRLYRL